MNYLKELVKNHLKNKLKSKRKLVLKKFNWKDLFDA